MDRGINYMVFCKTSYLIVRKKFLNLKQFVIRIFHHILFFLTVDPPDYFIHARLHSTLIYEPSNQHHKQEKLKGTFASKQNKKVEIGLINEV